MGFLSHIESKCFVNNCPELLHNRNLVERAASGLILFKPNEMALVAFFWKLKIQILKIQTLIFIHVFQARMTNQ